MVDFEETPEKEASFRARRLAIIDQILDSREKLTPREWCIVHLYYKSGLLEKEIAHMFGCTQQAISCSLNAARRKALS
jgi:DNA-directed RNA polymerase specialized sigma subunit